jgi:hypothetical protein
MECWFLYVSSKYDLMLIIDGVLKNLGLGVGS